MGEKKETVRREFGEEAHRYYKRKIEPFVKFTADKPPKGFPMEVGGCYYNEGQDLDLHLWMSKLAERERLAKKEFDLLEHIKGTIDRAIEGKEPTEFDKKLLKKGLVAQHTFVPEKRGDRWFPEALPDPSVFNNVMWVLALWVYWVWKGEIKVKHCQAEKCDKIFIPNPRGPEQKYCSKTCRDRELKRRYRRKKKQLSI